MPSHHHRKPGPNAKNHRRRRAIQRNNNYKADLELQEQMHKVLKRLVARSIQDAMLFGWSEIARPVSPTTPDLQARLLNESISRVTEFDGSRYTHTFFGHVPNF